MHSKYRKDLQELYNPEFSKVSSVKHSSIGKVPCKEFCGWETLQIIPLLESTLTELTFGQVLKGSWIIQGSLKMFEHRPFSSNAC